MSGAVLARNNMGRKVVLVGFFWLVGVFAFAMFKRGDFSVVPTGLWLICLSGCLGLSLVRKPLKINMGRLLLAGGVFLATTLPKIANIATVPRGVWVDEIRVALASKRALEYMFEKRVLIPFSLEATGHSGLVMALTGTSISLFGQTTEGIRFPAVIFSGLAAVGLFFLLKYLFDDKTALTGSLIFSYSPWGIALSRIGFEAGYYWLLEILALYFLIKISKEENSWNYLGYAVLLGLGVFTYLAFRTAVVAFVLAASTVLAIRFGISYKTVGRMMMVIVTIVLVISPLLAYYRLNPGAISLRTENVSIFGRQYNNINRVEEVKNAVIKTGGMVLGITNDPNLRHNPTKFGEINLLWVGVMMVGFAVLMRKKWWLLAGCLGIIGVVSAANGIFTYEPPYQIQPHSLRTLGLLPIMVIVISFGVNAIDRKLGKGWLVLGLAVITSGINYSRYLAAFTNRDVQRAYQFIETDTALLVRDRCQDDMVIDRKAFDKDHMSFWASECKYHFAN